MKIFNREDMVFSFLFVSIVLLLLRFFVNEYKVSRLCVLNARALPDAVLGADRGVRSRHTERQVVGRSVGR